MAIPSQPDRPAPLPAGQAVDEEENDPTSRMSFFDHLDEFRRRLLYSVAAIGAGLCVGLYFSNEAFEFLARPMLDALREGGLGDKLIYTSPLGPLRLLLTVGLYLGIVIASPFVLHQIWLFVAPGLYRHERRAGISFLLSSLFLFFAGTAFGYLVMLPITLKFLISFQGPFTPMISINDYFDLILVILLGLGVVFQLPILIFFLSLFGIVTPRFLWNNFRYAVLIIAIIAAVVTPTTDVFTMSVFMAPMLVLYVVGIGVSALVVRKKEATTREQRAPGVVAAVVTVVVVGAGVTALLWVSYHFGWWSLSR
jgi:sec-independent protein translocase protein TatC